MGNILIFMIGCGLGIICGMVFGVLTLSAPRAAKRGRQVRETAGKAEREQDTDVGLIKKRLKEKKGTWTDLNCSADDVSEESHIKQSRKKQNEAYRYAKRKKERS